MVSSARPSAHETFPPRQMTMALKLHPNKNPSVTPGQYHDAMALIDAYIPSTPRPLKQLLNSRWF